MIPKRNGKQKIVRIVKTDCNKDNPYAVINLAALNKAIKLPPNTFKLWFYMAANQNGYEFGLSSKDACDKCKFSRTTYDSAVKELIEKQYLIEVELYDGLTGYLFIDTGYGGIE